MLILCFKFYYYKTIYKSYSILLQDFTSRYTLIYMSNNNSLKEVILEAGRIALKYFGSADVSEKSIGNLLTNADLEVEKYIRSELQLLFPDDGLIGEEYGVLQGKNKRFWAIDPIDGTADYANGLSNWAISLALIEDSAVKTAFVYLPVINKFYHAEIGKGAYCNDRQIYARFGKIDAGNYFAINAGAHLSINFNLNLRLCNAPSAVGPCYVAEGLVLGSISLPAYIWDIAASSLIATEAGASFEYLSGAKFCLADLMNCSRMPEILICGTEEFRFYCRDKINLKHSN